jgi:hypothetical protein
MTAHRLDLFWMKRFLALVSHSSDVGSIPIARSINPVDAVGRGFPQFRSFGRGNSECRVLIPFDARS